ncbi:MAG: hypothetical protein SGBAC_012195 [Bacillariaceae sp.]
MPQATRNNRRKSPLQHLIAGGCAGLVESSICHPLDTVKTAMQLQNNYLKDSLNNTQTSTSTGSPSRRQATLRESLSSHKIKKRGLSTAITRRVALLGNYGPIVTARLIVQKDGFLALYRGLTAVYTGIVPKMAIRFLTFEQYKDWLSSYTPLGRSTSATFTAGLFAGLTEAILVVTPAEVCKIRMQSENTRQFKNVAHAAYSIVTEEGAGALYKGVIPTMFRQGCNQAVNFTAYNAIKTRVLQEEGKKELASWQSMMIGGFSGGMGPLVNNPVDVVKTRLQKQVVLENQAPKYTGLTQACFVIAKEEGIASLWKGITPRLLRIMPGQAITFTTYEAVSSIMYNRRNLWSLKPMKTTTTATHIATTPR